MNMTVALDTFIRDANGMGLSSPFVDDASSALFYLRSSGEVMRVPLSDIEAHAVRSATVVCNLGGSPQGLSVRNGTLYVADIGQKAVIAVDPKAQKAQTIVKSYEDSSLKGPHSIILDSEDCLIFTDSGPMGETGLWNPQGSCFLITGHQGEQVMRPLAFSCLAYPTGVACSPNGKYISLTMEFHSYVCEMMANRLIRFTERPKGVYLPSVFAQFHGHMGPTSVAVDSTGHIFVGHFDYKQDSSSASGKISVLDTDGRCIQTIETPGPQVTGLCVSELSGQKTVLYVTESSTSSVYKVTLETNLKT